MSMSHKASNLALHNRVCSIPEGGILFPFDSGLHGIDSAGNIIYPKEGAVATLRPNEGRFGGAVAVEEGTTNLVPSNRLKFEGWTAVSGAEVTVTQGYGIPGVTPDGATRIQTVGGTTRLKYYTYVSPDPGNPASLSVWVYNIGQKTVQVTGNAIHGEIDVAPGEIRRCTLSMSSLASSQRQIRFGVLLEATDSLDFIAYQPQIEAKPFATSFVDGTRAAGRLEYPAEVVPQNEGTIVGWFKMHPLGFVPYRYFWDSIGSRFAFYIRSSDKSLIARTNNSNERILGSLGSGFDETEWHQYALTWTDLGLNAYVDGELVGSYNGTIELPLNSGNVRFGTYRSGLDERSIGLIDELLILPYAATTEEMQSWYHSKAPMHNNLDTYITL
jgi:hypothetical protein